MIEPVTALGALREATKHASVLKWGWAVVGVVAILAIIFGSIGYRAGFVGGIAVISGMIVVFLFSIATRIELRHVELPAKILIYFVLGLFVSSSILILSSVFFNSPLPLRHWIVGGGEPVPALPIADECQAGMPGPTAWILVARFENGLMKEGPYVDNINANLNDPVTITRSRVTYINNFKEKGTADASQSPFSNMSKDIQETCRTFPSGTTFYYADRRQNGVNGNEYLYFRVRLTPVGG